MCLSCIAENCKLNGVYNIREFLSLRGNAKSCKLDSHKQNDDKVTDKAMAHEQNDGGNERKKRSVYCTLSAA